MLSTDNKSDIIKLKIHFKSGRISLISIIFILLVLFLFAINDTIESNKKISIECNKTKKTCIFREDKFLYSPKEDVIHFNSLGNAYLHLVGCSKGICSYDLLIPYDNKRLLVYSDSDDETYLNWFVEHFNENKNNQKINIFTISSGNHYFLGISLIALPIFLFSLYVIIFWLGYKETIIIDKKNNKLSITLHRIIWPKTKQLNLSQIKSLILKQNGSSFLIKYTSNDDKEFRLLNLAYEEKKLKPVFLKLNEELFSDLKNN